ncbi:hypothetical protein GEMRC1_011412 [Eukaryota sp. GEM-RC1]
MTDHQDLIAAKQLSATEFSPITSTTDTSDIIVCSRVRPVLPFDGDDFNVFSAHHPQLTVHEPTKTLSQEPTISDQSFTFDYSFGHYDDNNTVYSCVGQSQLEFAMSGNIAVVLAYGQTGSGKTYTVASLQTNCISSIFAHPKISELEVSVSVFEIQGTNAYDLISPSTVVHINEDVFGHVNPRDATVVLATSEAQLQQVVADAFSHRKTVGTLRNDTSSRSHAVTRISFKNLVVPSAEPGVLYLIDLAGSERASDQREHTPELRKQAKEINKSLMGLKECIRKRTLSFVDAKHHHIPYRQSKITLLLKDVFELRSLRQCRTCFFVCVSPLSQDVSHSINSLRYAAPMRVVSQGAKRNVYVDPKDPASYEPEKLARWVSKFSNELVDPVVFEGMSGMQVLRLTEADFISRCLTDRFSEKQAKLLYTKLWGKAIDCRTKRRSDLLDPKKHRADRENFDEELIARSKAEERTESARELLQKLY